MAVGVFIHSFIIIIIILISIFIDSIDWLIYGKKSIINRYNYHSYIFIIIIIIDSTTSMRKKISESEIWSLPSNVLGSNFGIMAPIDNRKWFTDQMNRIENDVVGFHHFFSPEKFLSFDIEKNSFWIFFLKICYNRECITL